MLILFLFYMESLIRRSICIDSVPERICDVHSTLGGGEEGREGVEEQPGVVSARAGVSEWVGGGEKERGGDVHCYGVIFDVK